MDSLEREIISIIKNNFAVDEVTPESKINDLGFSSFTFVKFVVSLEEAFHISFDFGFLDYKKFESVRDVIRYVEMCCWDQSLS